ncbi:hypothetical protein OCS_06382 [Ophiocordyceps sinensis CO18]|uniref:Uncharacterized protein n=1 Tax=Ophiocordyceps sinensis (strain Co18 / CGMCC 3.14243) TaxID=911162 RepID=T5A828_OPHSC|nr:hypothetical protein OCS_06382 [Ophiocordyceps sinensis CO18]
MVEKRAEAFQHVQRMRILNTWARSIVSALQKGQTFDHLQDLLHEGLKEPWDACSLPYCRDKLREMDRSQRVWTDEDSGALYYSEQSTSQPDTSRPDETAAKVPRVELTFTPLDGRVSRSVAVIVHGALSDSVCLATAGNDTWFLSGKPVTDISGLETERYDLERVPPGRTGKLDVYRACRLKVESWSWVAPPTLL